MKEIGLFGAKTNLSKIVDRVKRTGESVTLTKRGEPYVDLVPHQAVSVDTKSKSQVLDELDNLRKTLPKSTMKQIKADIEEGRR